MKNCSFIIAAAGSGIRAGGTPKQFRPLQNIPLWKWSLQVAERLYRSGYVSECVIAAPRDRVQEVQEAADSSDIPVNVVAGGKNRSESVTKALGATSSDYVLIHDAARPFLKEDLVLKLLKKLTPDCAVVPCIPVTDALKKGTEDHFLSPVDRSGLKLTQTPQAFHRKKLLNILKDSRKAFRDEAEAWLNEGLSLASTDGDPFNFKITYSRDWDLALIISGSYYPASVTGIGYDIHPLVPGKKLVLAGMEIPNFPLGAKGNSDGDLVLHSLCDALLGAAGLPDIGLIFPGDEPRYRNISSITILNKVLDMINGDSLQINSVDIVLKAQLPKLGPYGEGMKTNLRLLLSRKYQYPRILSLKFKSGESLGPAGRCECMEAWAVASVFRSVDNR